VRIELNLIDQIKSDPEGGILVEIRGGENRVVYQKKIVQYDTPSKMSFISESGLFHLSKILIFFLWLFSFF